MRTFFIPFSLAKTLEDAEFIAPTWATAVVKEKYGWLCFEKKPDADIWLGYSHL